MKNRKQELKTRGSAACRYPLLVAFFIFWIVYYLPLTVFANDISARSAIVIDSETEKILYAKNPNLKLPPASTAKVITAMVVLDRLRPDAIVHISQTAANSPSVTPHLKEGERYYVRDLLYLALMRSINGATVALAEAVAGSENAFTVLMNEKAAQLGTENTRFSNSSGLPGGEQYITAYDLAIIMKASLRYPLIRDMLNTKEQEILTLDGRRILIKNTNQLLWSENNVIGGKTGYTKAAMHCFVCAGKKGNNTLITVVLGEPSRDNLWNSTLILLERGDDVLAQRAEPLIHLTSASKKPVVFASYKKKGSTKKNKKTIKTKSKKGSNVKKASVKKDKKRSQTIKTAKKTNLKKNKGVRVVKKKEIKKATEKHASSASRKSQRT